MTTPLTNEEMGYCISTHTLTWSVTFFAMIENRIRFISTHTLTWSVTFTRFKEVSALDFNSHAHVERDEFFLFNTDTEEKFQLTRSRGA